MQIIILPWGLLQRWKQVQSGCVKYLIFLTNNSSSFSYEELPNWPKERESQRSTVTHSHLEAGSRWFWTSPWKSGVPQSSAAAAGCLPSSLPLPFFEWLGLHLRAFLPCCISRMPRLLGHPTPSPSPHLLPTPARQGGHPIASLWQTRTIHCSNHCSCVTGEHLKCAQCHWGITFFF